MWVRVPVLSCVTNCDGIKVIPSCIITELEKYLTVPYELLDRSCEKNTCSHQMAINNFYERLVEVLTCAARESIPLMHVGSIKPYWTEELQQLKEDSIQAHTAWVDIDKPRSGLINKLRLQAKYNYKRALKHGAFNFE